MIDSERREYKKGKVEFRSLKTFIIKRGSWKLINSLKGCGAHQEWRELYSGCPGSSTVLEFGGGMALLLRHTSAMYLFAGPGKASK